MPLPSSTLETIATTSRTSRLPSALTSPSQNSSSSNELRPRIADTIATISRTSVLLSKFTSPDDVQPSDSKNEPDKYDHPSSQLV